MSLGLGYISVTWTPQVLPFCHVMYKNCGTEPKGSGVKVIGVAFRL